MVSCPEIIRDEEILNRDNPFKKELHQTRLRCTLCADKRIILGKAIGTDKDWNVVQRHMRIWHNVEIGDDIPIRLLSQAVLKRWIKQHPVIEAKHTVI